MAEERRSRIRCYVSLANNNKIRDWYEDLFPQERADADQFIQNMMKTRDWSMPNYRPKLNGLKGVGELRWQSCGKAHRLIGFFMKGHWYALVGCTHKQKVYNPADALDTAKRYKGQIERGEARWCDYDL